MHIKKWQKLYTLQHYGFGNDHKKYYGIDHDRVISPGGAEVDYFVLRISPHSVVIAVTPEQKILCVRQHRYATNEVTIELPMGNSDGGDLLIAARRELEEETGYTAIDLKEIGKYQEANGIAEFWGHVFFTKNAVLAEKPAQDPEDKNLIELCSYTVPEIQQMIAQGHITDASSICAFSIAYFGGKLSNI
ncbi:MAG: NUDIX hydrolase [Patescibacteria group bacterium]|nr:NUDIX hydrolase [Patescibacteria group bacterium]